MIIEALTKEGVPPELASRARAMILGFKEKFATLCLIGTVGTQGEWKAEGLLAILLGASLLKACGISDVPFAAGRDDSRWFIEG